MRDRERLPIVGVMGSGRQPHEERAGALGACAAEGARVQAPIQSRWLRCETLLGFTTAAVPRLASGSSRRLGHVRPLPRRLLAPFRLRHHYGTTWFKVRTR